MNRFATLVLIVGCTTLAACGGGATDETVNADNMMMTDNLGTTDMNMDMNADMNMSNDMNMDMNADADMNADNAADATENSY